jgi:hypothetical protein
MSNITIKGTQSHIVETLRSCRENWGAPGNEWSFVGNYRQITITTNHQPMVVWLTLTNKVHKIS